MMLFNAYTAVAKEKFSASFILYFISSAYAKRPVKTDNNVVVNLPIT